MSNDHKRQQIDNGYRDYIEQEIDQWLSSIDFDDYPIYLWQADPMVKWLAEQWAQIEESYSILIYNDYNTGDNYD